MLTPQEAVAEVLSASSPLGAEVAELGEALGRVLCAAVRAGRELPPWDNSAMDGYAVRAAEVAPGQPLPVAGTIAAGQVAPELPRGQALRIMTGAPLPAGADAVIMREEAEEAAGQVRFRQRPAVGQHVRRAGEDVARGDEVLRPGAVVGPGEVGLLAALGRTLVPVHRRPLVTIVSTGDELVPADQAPGPGQIVGSNAHALAAQVRLAGGVPRVMPIARDDREALAAAFREALQGDVVLSSGGVSVGDFDHVKGVLAGLGVQERFWQVAMKPGKPLSFGVRPREQGPPVPVFGLPGNPASSMVSFELFVYPALRRLLGHEGAALSRPRARVRLAGDVAPDPRRLHYLRARVRRLDDGALAAEPAARQGSGMLRSMVGINALLEVPAQAAPLLAGSELTAHLLEAI